MEILNNLFKMFWYQYYYDYGDSNGGDIFKIL